MSSWLWRPRLVASFTVSFVLSLVVCYVVYDPIPPQVHVRWREGVSPSQQVSLEVAYGLSKPEHTEGTTWSYSLIDTSTENIQRLVQDPAVDDTHMIDRVTFELVEPPPAPLFVLLLSLALSGIVGVTVASMVAAVARLRRPIQPGSALGRYVTWAAETRARVFRLPVRSPGDRARDRASPRLHGSRAIERPPLPGPGERAAVRVFFLVLLLVGLVAFRDYGVPWDEPIQRRIGAVSLRYVIQTVAPWVQIPETLPTRELEAFNDRDYGVVFEMPAVGLELLLGLTETRDIYRMRHLLVFLVFFAGVFALYRVAVRRFGDWRIGLLAAAILVLSPRIFADAFYNSKDLVFMAAFLIATNTMLAFVTKPGTRSACAHALATAVAIDLRVVAIGLVPLTAALLGLGVIRRDVTTRTALSTTGLFLGGTVVLVVLFFPWLWGDPFGRFLGVVESMSSFQRFSDRVRYMGDSIMPGDLPWHYLPRWIAISTPLPYLVLFGVGVVATLKTLLVRRIRVLTSWTDTQDLVFLALLCVPILAIVATHTVVYDGWRHVYFVYPALVLIAVRGWVAVWEAVAYRPSARRSLAAATGVALTITAAWMVRAHPMQNVYFNPLAGHDWRRHYELDYWGLGNRAALEYVLTREPSPRVVIRVESVTDLATASLTLSPEDQQRVEIVRGDSPADYVLTNYRGVDVDAADQGDDRELFYQLTVDSEPIVSVYRTKP